jgi:hypothetical protein
VAAVLATAALSACGRDVATIESARSPFAATLTDVPNFPGSVDRWGIVTRDDGLLTESFVVRGAGRERIAAWFDHHLQRRGWTGIRNVATDGRLASRRLFMKDNRVLMVAIASAPVVNQAPPFDETTSKYSLVLYPHGFPTFTAAR